jgi:hypothetical protein
MSTIIFAPIEETFGNIFPRTLEGLLKEIPKLKEKTDNKQTTWAKTHALTPDKMDRLPRMTGGNILPYPLTEEEATPQVPTSDETQ